MSNPQIEAIYENQQRRIDPARVRPPFPGALNAVCRQLQALSYADMRRLADALDESERHPHRDTADRLLKVAERIIAEDTPAKVPHNGRGPG